MKLLLKRILSYVPTSVPTGMTKFDAYVQDIVALCGPIASAEDIEWVVDAEMMRIAPKANRIPKNDFVRSIKVAAAKQLAGARFQALKEKQQLKQAEATAQTVVANEETKV
jgi:hypothetical protein